MKLSRIRSCLFTFLFFLPGFLISQANTTVAKVSVIIPSGSEKAYEIAGEIFVEYWEKLTGTRPALVKIDWQNYKLPENDLILIGSDAVNPAVHDLIGDGTIEQLNIQYGIDNYRLLSAKSRNRDAIIIAGGSGRSTIYGVYDFFRKKGEVEYFWDGDVFQKQRPALTIADIDVYEKPHFEYRGLRYFAHRSLHRFQAEHWNYEDWKREIDWCLKKRFNLFMLRTGIDDLFNRAFPDIPYPPVDDRDPDAKLRSYDDRTSFWQLRYRGELRKKVLEYARDRGLLHPEDVGTITHWYSHTPSSFYINRPDFPVLKNQRTGYTLSTASIWDINKQEAWDAYWKLTDTHIKEFGGGNPRLFHTIGLAERTFGKTERENLQYKLFTYRKIKQQLLSTYPDVPLLIAGWDFTHTWKVDADVRNLLKEFDKSKTIFLDYTADINGRATYKNFGMYKSFPWIFGIFHSFAKNSDIHGNYDLYAARIKESSEDEFCKGLVLWPEISHSDTYLLEYLGRNSWNPNTLNSKEATLAYCRTRYPEELQQLMQKYWHSFLPLSQTVNFGSKEGSTSSVFTYGEPQFRLFHYSMFTTLTDENITRIKGERKGLIPMLKVSDEVLPGLAALTAVHFQNEFWKRDALDMARTIASRALFAALSETLFELHDWKTKNIRAANLKSLEQISKNLMAAFTDLLSLSDDFSMRASLEQLKQAEPLNGIYPHINPHSEYTLKGNSENSYCRSHQFEIAGHLYKPELDLYWSRVNDIAAKKDFGPPFITKEISAIQKNIADRFYELPLEKMTSKVERAPQSMSAILERINKEIRKLASLPGIYQ